MARSNKKTVKTVEVDVTPKPTPATVRLNRQYASVLAKSTIDMFDEYMASGKDISVLINRADIVMAAHTDAIQFLKAHG